MSRRPLRLLLAGAVAMLALSPRAAAADMDAEKAAGLKAFQQGDMKVAYDTLKPLVKRGTKDLLLLFHLGKAAAAIDDAPLAAECLERYVEAGGPGEGSVYFGGSFWTIEEVTRAEIYALRVAGLGAFEIACTQADAKVKVGGWSGACPLQRSGVVPGAYTVSISVPGYAPVQAVITVKAKALARFVPRLEALPGKLSVTLPEGVRGEVFLGERKLGNVADSPFDVPAGEHAITVKSKGLADWTGRATVAPGGKATVDAKPGARTGTLAVRSEPPGATVLVDGEELGQTPLEEEVTVGKHTVEVTLEHHKAAKKRVKIKDGATTAVDVRLKPTRGTLLVTSEPAGSKVLVDGEEIGTTPLERDGIRKGKHVVGVQRAGYRPWKKKVKVRAGRTLELTAALEPILGALAATSTPAGALVLVDGEEVGKTPLAAVPVVATDHQVVIRADQYSDWTRRIAIQEGQQVDVQATLTRAPSVVSVRTVPAGAKLTLADNEIGPTPVAELALPEGKHKGSLTLAGYRTESIDWTLEAGRHKEVEIALVKEHGLLSITSEPSGAKVTLDGGDRGTTPINGLKVDPGEHQLHMSLGGYVDWSRDMTLVDAQEMKIGVPLRSSWMAWGFLGASVLAGGGAVFAGQLSATANDKMDTAASKYALTTDQAEIAVHRGDASAHYDDAQTWLLGSRVLFGIAAGLAGWGSYSMLTDPYGPIPAPSSTKETR